MWLQYWYFLAVGETSQRTGSVMWRVRVPHALDQRAREAACAEAVPLSEYVRRSVEESIHADALFLAAPVPAAGEGAELERRYSVVSLFTGAGGLDVGLGSVGRFDLLAAVELEGTFCKTLERNRDKGLLGSPSTRVLQRDLSLYTPEELMADLGLAPGELDLLVGGPPCQSWSTAGRRGGPTDPRGMLIWKYLDFVRVLRPKAFLVENVRGLLSAALRHRPIAQRPVNGGEPLRPEEQPGSAYETWLSDLLAIGEGEYRVDTFEVNAVNYGAPQIRERVLIFGNRLGLLTPCPRPTHSDRDPALSPFRTLRQALEGLSDPRPVLLDFSERKKRYLSQVPTGGNWRSLDPEVAKESMGRAYYAKGGRSGWWRRLSWDLPSPTITTMPNHSSTSLCHPEETRVLSVCECARVQEFPDGWEFLGTPAEQMKQVGNAVPARLGRVAGGLLAQILDGEAESADGCAPRATRTYVRSHVRTRRWWQDGHAVILGADQLDG